LSVSDNAMGRYSGADAWIEQYFHNSPDTDREGYTSAQLEALARTHRELAQTRAPGTPLIEVHDTEYSTMVLIVNDDMPHLVSSITAYVSSEFGGIESIFHPLFVVERGPDGNLLVVRGTGVDKPVASGDTATLGIPALKLSEDAPPGSSVAVESWIALRLTRHLSAERVQALREGATKTLSDVHAAARDNEKMVLQVNNIITSMDALRGVTLGDGQESFNAHPSLMRRSAA